MRTLHLPIADPCHEDWDAMDANEQGRFCGKCTKQVHDLSTMTEPEAQSLLRARAGGRICVRYEHDDAGRIRFRPASLARTALAGVALAACTPHDHPSTQVQSTQSVDVVDAPAPVPIAPTVTMGDVAPEPVKIVKGEIGPEPPMEIHVRKGDIAVPNEPCDPPKVVEPEEPKPVRVKMGKPMMRHDDL
jgi:hypothetical protein